MPVLPVWYKGLTPELRKFAELTIRETSDVKAKTLLNFRRLINEQPDIYSRLDEVFLLRFLRTKKYDLQKSFKLFVNYYHFRAKQTGSFTGMKPSDMKKVIEMEGILYAPYRLPSGSHVATVCLGKLDVNKATVQDLFATGIMIGEMILDCEATQVCGGVIVIDLSGMTVNHYRQFLSTQFLSLCISLFQDSLPERVKGIHVVNESRSVYAIFRILKPLLKKKTRDRLHFHGNDLNSLHKCVPKEYLPERLGGILGPRDYKKFASYFYSQESFIERINKYGLLEKTRAH